MICPMCGKSTPILWSTNDGRFELCSDCIGKYTGRGQAIIVAVVVATLVILGLVIL